MKAFPIETITKISGTRAEILAQTPTTLTMGYATDTNQCYLYDGGWLEFSNILNPRDNPVDMGSSQDSNLAGYGQDYITDKRLNNVSVGSNQDERDGAIRRVFASDLNRELFQFYAGGQWNTILTGVNIQTDREEAAPDIEFSDFAPWVLSLITGNSDEKDPNGVPIIQDMKMDIGLFSSPLTISGGTF